jgi:RNA polymerase sigma-70 factor, ECF subfamily
MTDFSQELIEMLPRLRRFARALTRSEADADDLTQACVERALRNVDRWQPGTRLDSWLYRIAQNLWRDELRAHRRRAEPLDEINDPMGEDGRDSHLNSVHALEVAEAFERLPEDQRTVMALVALDGLSYAEAADVLGIPVGTVMSRIARARGRLASSVDARPQGLRAAK